MYYKYKILGYNIIGLIRIFFFLIVLAIINIFKNYFYFISNRFITNNRYIYWIRVDKSKKQNMCTIKFDFPLK